ncbi:hypothetical protein GCM10023093_01340 [Nemorincola caseinilytica]|uniref:Uncharacterized protein n=1 Tax=Nemorincola caseinilytica TaxID=2054315 RepID=A0ABP8N1M9_9BACT
MNWRIIAGLVLLIVGIRVMYIAINASGGKAWSVGFGGAIWITVGTFLIVKAMISKPQN